MSSDPKDTSGGSRLDRALKRFNGADDRVHPDVPAESDGDEPTNGSAQADGFGFASPDSEKAICPPNRRGG